MIFLNALWLIPAGLFITAYFCTRRRFSDDWQRVIPEKVYLFLRGNHLNKPSRQLALLITSLLCLALAGPSIETEDPDAYRHTQGWIIIADVSRSMTLEDIRPSRLSAMRTTALDLAEHANANSTSLIIYAGDAFIIVPPSFDATTFRNSVALLEHGVVPVEGSNLTRAASLALSLIESAQLLNARLFVLSDTGGFNNNSDAAIAQLAKLGHRTDFILFGSDAGDAVPFDLQAARSHASSGNGQLVIASSIGQVDLQPLDLSSNLSDESLLTHTGITGIRWHNQSHWLLLFGLPLLLWLFYREMYR